MTDEEAPPEPKKPWFDPICAILMAVCSLLTAWCSYQNYSWSAESGDLEAHADKLQRQATAMHLEARQTQSVYVRLVMEVIDDKLEGREKQAEFYLSRFSPELRAAWDKWMELKPFESGSKAPAHPFLPDFYTHPLEADIQATLKEAHESEDRSRVTGQTAGTYLANTVLLATVLFFAGTAGSFDRRRVRWSALAFASILFIYAAARTLMLPMA